MKRFFTLGIIIFSSLFLITACSDSTASKNEDPPKKKEEKEEKAEFPKAATDPEDMMLEGPGKLVNDSYSEEAMKEAFKKIPNKLSTQEAYDAVIHYLAEDYKEDYDYYKNLNTTIEVPGNDKPGNGKTLNVAILLDSSGSMAAKIGEKTKMEIAKEAVRNYASKLPQGSNVMLRVYGQKGSNADSDKKVSCESTEVVYELNTYNEGDFQNSLDQFKPTGWTPIAGAIQAAQKDLEGQSNGKAENLIYVVSDGVETCDGDPAAAAKSIAESSLKAKVNVIGFDVNDKGQQSLEEIAQAGGGEYQSVNSAADFEKYLLGEKNKLWLEWQTWSDENFMQVQQIASDKFNEVQNRHSDILNKIVEEKSRLEKGVRLLNELKKVENGFEVEKLINSRYNTLVEYDDDTFKSLQNEIEDNRDALQETIENKRNQEQGSLN
ncbi:VWA domain-containing protein [Fictibacillus halophilus]|uniref:VWA domain-containing protein n=1 Tax=Fictibacillus halophilus TaxID=1610490 RepID=UPI001CFB67FC|nr:VWA domain-containing protein [Fictibacillus halophilus]